MKDKIISIGLDFGPGLETGEQFMIRYVFNNLNLTNHHSVKKMKEMVDLLPEMRAFEDKIFNQVLDKAAAKCAQLSSPYDARLMEVAVYFFTKKMLATFLESYDYFCEDMAKLEESAKKDERSAEFFKHSVLQEIKDFVKSTPKERQRKEIQKRNEEIRRRNEEVEKHRSEEELEEEEEEP